MGVVRRRRHYHRHHRLLTALAFLLFASASAVSLAPPRHRGKNSKTHQTHLTQSRFFPHGFPGTGGLVGQEREERKRRSGSVALERVLTQKRLGGPGSSPPTCRSKCGRCAPCKAVHVPIQPGFSIPLEYYPEAWRCKCGNKLFMPWKETKN